MNGTFSRQLNAQIATKMLFSLEYMHRKRYAHADIKGANILLGNEVTHDKEEVYLIDFGLAYLLPANPVEKPDPKAKHDGTIEYCSTDAHAGCKPSFRGDLEILMWNLAHWASGELPWLQYVKEGMPDSQKEKVAELKRKNLKSSGEFLEELGLGEHKELVLLMKYLRGMKYGDEIDFNKVRSFFTPQLPPGKSLAFTKIRSRKSFVPGKKLPKVKRNTTADTESTPVPASSNVKKAAATKPRATPIASKSAAEKVKLLGRQGRSKKPVYDFSSDDDIENKPAAPSSTRSRRKQKSDEQVDEDFSPVSSKKSQKTTATTSRARVSKRAKPKTSTEEDSLEISVPTKQPAKKQARSTDSPSVRSSTRASARKIQKTQETIAETSEEDLPKATPKARSVKNKATRKKQLERQAAKAESINTTSEEELFKEPQMIKTKDVNRGSAILEEENQENIPPESEDEITFKIQSRKSLKLNLSVDAETSTELFDDSTEIPVNRTNRDESMSVSGDERDLENENVKVHFDGGPSGDEPRPVVYKRSPDPSRFLQLEDELVEDASKEPPKLAPNKKYIGELDFEEINKAQRESRKKRMPQPGKNLCPRDQSMQTIASWFQERPEKVRKLRAQLAEEKPFFAAIPKKC